jgi:hypothetical protein
MSMAGEGRRFARQRDRREAASELRRFMFLKRLACLAVGAMVCVEACTSNDDVVEDAGQDAVADHAVDVMVEAAVDATRDVGQDVLPDTAIDSSIDVADVFSVSDASVDGPGDAPLEAGDGGSCTTTSECNDSGLLMHYCAKSVGDCAGSGVCLPVPNVLVCGITPPLVCGCDDKTYTNACLANAFGVDVQYAGACE